MSIKIAQTRYGMVEGIRSGIPTTVAFRGIPFAAPPVGELRWKPPKPPAPWKGVLKCFEYAPVCMQEKRQPDSFAAREFYAYQPDCSEDSLYLNLWTPAESPEDRLPVMVYLHGGANTQGYNCKIEADGDILCKHGVVYVCAAYRLGLFGFLAHPWLSQESGCGSGNYGLLDQLAVLRWVQENIAAFGGDPNNVTLFGQSAGGADMQALLCSTLSEGLFHRGISQSAGGLLPVIQTEALDTAEARGLYFQEASGCKTLAQMRALSAERILRIAADAPAGSPIYRSLHPLCIDHYVLREPVSEALESGRCMDVPLIMGCTSDEGLADFPNPNARMTEGNVHEQIRAMYGPYADRAQKWYHPEDEREVACMYKHIWGDSMRLGYHLWASAIEKTGRKNAYVYLFNRQLPDADGISRNGAFHSSDLWYTFGNFYRSWRPMASVDFTLAQAMNAYWTNFAKTGNPNGPGIPIWQPYRGSERNVMLLGENIGMCESGWDIPLFS